MANYDLSSFERNGNTYTYRSEIPIASAETLGGIKVGQNLSIDPLTGALSADGSSNVEDLDDLSDVTLSSPSNGQILKYNNGTWGNANELALGETASTAYAGDKGKSNADAIAAIKDGESIDSFADVESALSAVPSALGDLSDVSTTGVASGQVLTYNGTGWEGATPSAGTVIDVQIDSTSIVSGGVANISTMTGAGASAAGTKGLVPAPSAGDENKFLAGDGTWKTGGGSGASALDDLTDVTIVSAAPGDILKYDDTNDVWTNAPEVQEMTQTAYNALTPAQKADGSVRYVHDEPTTEFAETVLGTTYEYSDLSSSNATDLIVVVSNGSVAWAGFKFDLSTGESSVLTAAEITEAAAILQMQVSTNFTCTITQDLYTPSCVWVNNDWYNTSTIYLDATDISNVGVRNSYYEFSTSLLYKTVGDNGNNIYLNNRSYSGSGGGGTTVVANPSGTATDELEKIQIGDTIYDIVGGSGSSFITTLDHENRTTLNTSFTLSDSIINYDLIMFQIYYTGSSDDYTGSRIFNVNDLVSGDHASKVWINGGNNDRAVEIEIIDTTHYQIINSNGSNGIYGVYGIKLSGGNTPITTETTTLFNDTIKGIGNYTLEDSYENYDFITIVGGIQSDEQYSCKEVRTYSVAGLKAFFSANVANNIIFSGYAYRNFRFRIVNDVFTILDSSEQGLYTIYGHKFMGGGGSGNLTAVELTQAEYDLLTTEEKNDTNKIYFVTDGTEDTEFPSYTETTIYESSTDENTYNLSKPITNFDAIVIMAQYTGQISNAIISRTFLSSEMIKYIGTDNRFELASDANYIWVGITDASTFTKKAQFDFKIIKFIGINYGLGKGIGKNAEIIPITNGNDTTTRTFTFSRAPKRISVTYNSTDNWLGNWSFIWGDTAVTGVAMSKQQPAMQGAYSGIELLSYGSDGKSFTITGHNSFGAWNMNGGYGQMYVDYGESNNQLQEDYSLTEQRIGTWIDGKPVYQTTYEVDLEQSGNSWVNTGIVISDIKSIISVAVNGIDRTSGMNNCPASTTALLNRYNNSNLQVYIIEQWFLTIKNITVRYTKTTD